MKAGWLLERMATWRDAPALAWRESTCTYGELLDRVGRWQRVLEEQGVGGARVVALEADYSPNACALLLALVDRGVVAVPLSHAVRAHRERYLTIAEAQAIVSFDPDDAWTIEYRNVAVTHELTRRLVDAGDPGLVLFSSGSTGTSKAALHNFRLLLEKFMVPRHRKVILTFLLFDHIGGVNTLFYTLANGGTVVVASGRDPDAVCRAIERHRVQVLPTSPTFLNLLLVSEAYKRHDLSSLELITYGTEVMPEATLRRVRRAIPHARLQQTYGLSEIGILRSKSRDSDSLWVKVGGEGFETKVVDGVLWVRARSAMLGYLNAPSPFDADGWLNTEDQVEVDGDYVRILGRRTDIINVGGLKVYPAEVESVLLEMPNVRDATVRGEPNALLGQVVVARLSLNRPMDAADVRQAVREFCRDRLQPHQIPVRIEITEADQFTGRFKKSRRQ
jgi:acyl-coenzyme A synthetase/AMP-(fatty) acid ligase